MSGQLPASVEVAALLRRVEATGDFGVVLRRGDPDRGAILLVLSSRGRHVACLERVFDLSSGTYRWEAVGPPESASSAQISDFLARRARFDEDAWAVELDIADAERFIAETTAVG